MNKIQEEIKGLKMDYQENLQSFFREEVDKFFAEHPEVESFGLVFYTPFWNDGEECRFRVLDYNPEINGIDFYEFVNKFENGEKISNDVVEFLSQFNYEGFFKDAFGDHSELTVTRNYIERKEYDHD